MNRLNLLALCLLLCNFSFAQKGIRDFVHDLNVARTDSEKVEAYKRIIIYYSYRNADSETLYANEGTQYCKSKNYSLGEAKILEQQAILDVNQGRVEPGKQRTETALRMYRQLHYLRGIAEMTSNMGTIEATEGNFDAAIKNFITALKIYDTVPENTGIMLTNMNMGNVYLEHGDSANAWKFMQKAQEISKVTPVSNTTIFLNDIVGVMYAGCGNPDTALKIFRKSLQMSDRPEFAVSNVECISYLAEYFLDTHQVDSALKYLNMGLERARKYGIVEYEGNILFELAQIKESTNIKEAIEYLEDAKKICEQIHNNTFLIEVSAELTNAYKKAGDFENALKSTELRQKIADSIFNIKKTKEIEKIDKAYELEKNKKILLLEDLNQRTIEKRNGIIVVTLSLVLILAVLLFYFRKARILNSKLMIREQELEEMNTMKDKLFSIIGHDLRSPLTQIPAILTIYDDPDTTEEEKKFMFESLKDHSLASLETLDKLLMWGKSLVKGNSLTPVKLNTRKMIKQNIELKKTAAMEKNITVTDNTAPDVNVYCDATHFDFIIRNLLANALKYTYPSGKIEINADKNKMPGFVVFEVKDNGTGIDKELQKTIFNPLNSKEGTANEKGAGIGLMLCKEFVGKNGGNIWVESEVGKGTSFYFSIKSA